MLPNQRVAKIATRRCCFDSDDNSTYSNRYPLLRAVPAWKALEEHYAKVGRLHLRQLFAEDPQRGGALKIRDLGLYFDYSKHRITAETIQLLLDLAGAIGLRQRIDAMFRGDKINVTENRSSHT